MDLEELKADIMALRKLYGLLDVNEDGFQNTALQNLDERSWLLLRNLLDGAAQNLFEQFIKESDSPTRSTRKPNRSSGLTPHHSSTEAIHNMKTPSHSMNNTKVTEYDPHKGISIKKGRLQYREEKTTNQTSQENQHRMKEISIFRENTPRREYSTLNYRARKSPFYSSGYESDQGSWTSPFSPTSVSGRSCGRSYEEDSSNSESYTEKSVDSFSSSGGRRSSWLSRDGSKGVVCGRKGVFRVGKSGSRRSSYHTYSGFLKKPFGRLRKLRNKLALIFHHHHHHHHHHGSVDNTREKQKESPEGKEVVRVEERKKGKKAVRGERKGGKKKANFGTLVRGLKQHVRNSKKKKKKKLKHPKMEKGGGGSCRELRWWKMFHKMRGRGGGRALEKRMRHGLVEEKYENSSF